jgi:predicted extracellular nuclease
LREEFFLSQFYGILVEKTPEDTTMAETNQTQREEELARREALLAQREAQLEKEQAELAAAKAQSAEGKKTLLDNNDPNFVNPKEKLYDKFPLTVHQMDIIIGVLFALILLFLVLGMTHTSFFGLFGG